MEQIIFAQNIKKFLHCYGTQSFITVITGAAHSILCWANWIQSTPSLLLPV